MSSINDPLNRKLRMALIGGGGNAFIGRVHATAATLDNRAELIASALSSNPEKAREAAPIFGVAAERAFGSFTELIDQESCLSENERIDFVSIATPNYTHFEIASAALQAGFNVVCDKPMTVDCDQADELVKMTEQSGAVFALTHNYTGYPLVRQAREMIFGGELGEVQAVRVNYIQGWLRSVKPGTTPARGAWKADPKKNGPSGAMGDIGTHAFNLARYMTGLVPQEISCRLKTLAPDRQLDDYGHALVRCSNDSLCMITVSQVTHGRLNDLSIEIDGTKASIFWKQEDPNQLVLRQFGQPMQIFERDPAASFTNEASRAASRIPGGHPEGFFEAFANVYADAFDDMIARVTGVPTDRQSTSYPNVYDGREGVRFVEKCVASNQQTGEWLNFD